MQLHMVSLHFITDYVLYMRVVASWPVKCALHTCASSIFEWLIACAAELLATLLTLLYTSCKCLLPNMRMSIAKERASFR